MISYFSLAKDFTVRMPARFSSATVFKEAFSSLIASYTASSFRSIKMAMKAAAIMQKVGRTASFQFKLYMQNKIIEVCITTSIMSIPTKVRPSQILSTSSLTRLISSPVPVRSKNSALKDWMCRNKSRRIWEEIADPVMSKVYSFAYWKMHRPIPTPRIPRSSGASKSVRSPRMTSSTMRRVSWGESISRETLITRDRMANENASLCSQM